LKQITLRDIPYEIERLIKIEAEKKGLSLNKAFLSLLEKATGIKAKEKKKKAIHHDLDRLCGIWTKDDAEAFEKTLELQRKIDESLWKKAG
jgi:hypothetical protein